MTSPRIDLSSWILHFVHDRNPENNAAFNINKGVESPAFPYQVDRVANERFEHWEMIDEHAGLAPDEDAFVVLLKILEDGHIRSGWSWRNTKPTIYGPRAACCFTEMPLYALLNYAEMRTKVDVGQYAIGLLRDEFFAAGGRPAIYGLSTPHLEISPKHPLRSCFRASWPRFLDPSCGIGEREQYRYVSTLLGANRRIDWLFEREWRWADGLDEYSCPGLPVWLSEQNAFSKVMIVVSTDDEAETVLDKIKELHDAREHNFSHEYNVNLLEMTYVISLEMLSRSLSSANMSTIRLEDIPARNLAAFKAPIASARMVAKVKNALRQAHLLAEKAAIECCAKIEKDRAKGFDDGCGFSHVVIYNSQSEIVNALEQLGEISVIGGQGYRVSSFGRHGARIQSLAVAEAAATAAAEFLGRRFPQVIFSTRSRED